jgi:poly(3-hydroxyoctanoate) depolymerase
MRTMTPKVKQESGFIETAGQRVRYRVRGDGPPLLMINGLGAPLEFLRPLEPKLGDFCIVTVDAPGAGRSSTPEGPFGMDRFAEVMEDVLDHLGMDAISVLGLSFGGQIAQELARRSPGLVWKLILVSTVCTSTVNPRAIPILARRAQSLYRRYAADSGTQLRGPEPSLPRLQWGLLRKLAPSGRGFFVQSRASMTWSSRRWLNQLEMPVLVIHGTDDPLVPLRQSMLIASSVRDGRLEVIPGGGHTWILKEPAAASRLIRAFLT